MESSTLLMHVWSQTMPVLAQAQGSKPIVGAIVIVVLVLFVVGLAIASRRDTDRSVGDEQEVADVPDYDKPNLDVLSNRADISDFEGKSEEEMSLAELREYKRALDSSGGGSRRETAVEATAKSREKHEKLESDREVESDQELGFDDSSSWADASTVLDDDGVDDGDGVASLSEDEVKGEDTPESKTKVLDSGLEARDGSAQEETTMAKGLQKTRERGFGRSLKKLFQRETLDDALKDELEEFLYSSDIGAKAAQRVMNAVNKELAGDEKKNPAQVWGFVRAYVQDMLKAREDTLDVSSSTPFVILVIGVNGAGKTTTIGKLASKFKHQGKSVMLVAGDTFRAAAVEQLEVWADRTSIPIHKGKSEADPASVVYSGIERGLKESVDVIICDTSGRLHTNANLMDELKKIERVSGKAFGGAPHETILVLDANMGQNAVQQARTFGGVLTITGLVLTKLDGTARGGVILGIGEEMDVPVRYVGIGEGVNDLRAFDAEEFAEALFM